MTDIIRATEKYEASVTAAKNVCVKYIGSEVLNMGAEELEMLKVLVGVVDASTELLKEQAQVLDGIETKLNELLSR